ncbi:hypothetical protein QJS04_geneDACA001469 [Acorus gramineus]|uniref:Prolamin-like domain-containing protein n=1 Tax=Acorus gramineus TaxID=55184 RepID=A0AAV9A5Q4_ACOGR|nr:hypothetical protein QJS04_geneDACA001469 [Acorus gramineus]
MKGGGAKLVMLLLAAVAVAMCAQSVRADFEYGEHPFLELYNGPPIPDSLKKTDNQLTDNTTAIDPSYTGGMPPFPSNLDEASYSCWSYLGRGKIFTELKAYFINFTMPSQNTCQGVSNLHDGCWPDMFVHFKFASYRLIWALKSYCTNHAG